MNEDRDKLLPDPPKGTNFNIEHIYIKDSSFESPYSPKIFIKKDFQLETEVNMNVGTLKQSDTLYEVIMKLRVTGTSGEDVIYLAEVQQAGLFSLENFSDEALHGTLGAYCPGILHAYARQHLASMISNGGFEPVHLPPVNFGFLYDKHMEQKQEEQQAES